MRRPKFIILLLALLIGAVIVFWPSRPPVPPAPPTPVAPPKPEISDIGKPAALFYNIPNPAAKPEIDPTNQKRADALNAPDQPVENDLAIIAEFVDLYGRAFGSQPIGDNADITAALTGTQYPGQKGQVFPRQHSAIRSGQLVDRWGTPFWFHPNGPGQLEIRSAGPDKQMFTTDDIVKNPSPPGLGVTPVTTPTPP